MAKTSKQKELIRSLYNQVQSNKAALESASIGRYITDGAFKANSSAGIVQIKSSNSVTQLRDALASLISVRSNKKEANAILGITEVFTHQGATEEEWIADFKTRIAVLNNAALRAQVEDDEKTLLSMDPSILAEIKLDEIAKRNAGAAVTA